MPKCCSALLQLQCWRLVRVSLSLEDSPRSQQAAAPPRPANSSHSALKNFPVPQLRPPEPVCSAPPHYLGPRLPAAGSSAPIFSAATVGNYRELDSPVADP